ncbi:PEP/pyruvate-binding domain-containing protein [Desulfosediminicola ganghwensis]|uniref:PEP/pyruvate-binding domain-containing protein n=1 Tax=Desulfosediminicola ganghwensis TaxID=2569540 RepID=UPI0010ABDCDA|nr:PEP/pyruvate-binding domain-containing protein [Desulfosediminicola ganghwensis]
MKQIFLLDTKDQLFAKDVGGKALALAKLLNAGELLPKTACLTTAAYKEFLEINRLSEKIQMELNTKEFSDMRWEEIWDISLRIRQFFLATSLPRTLASTIHDFVRTEFGEVPLAVRSSATEEDGSTASFAGLHESYLNIRSQDQLERAIRKVWASLWSDKALLYRQELQLAVGSSAMAIVIQELLPSSCAGVGFTHDPMDSNRMVIEAVHGLNQGLVDGEVPPDRFQVNREDYSLVAHIPPEKREKYVIADQSEREGVEIAVLPPELAEQKPLDIEELETLVQAMDRLEKTFDTPLDIEWCRVEGQLYILQARPITAISDDRTDRRAWYLSLHRSFQNLQGLWQVIEKQMLPQMEDDWREMAVVNLTGSSDNELAGIIRHRFERVSYWSKRYWDDCIPFAHGIRLFGEIFNEVMAPADPYLFVSLLSGEEMLSTKRNAMLKKLASMVRAHPQIQSQFNTGGFAGIEDERFCRELEKVESIFGNFFIQQNIGSRDSRDNLVKVILQYATLENDKIDDRASTRRNLENQFLSKIGETTLNIDGEQLLSLGRASYRMRDDDNIYMGKIEQQLSLAVAEGRSRLATRGMAEILATPEEIAALLAGEQVELIRPAGKKPEKAEESSKIRLAKETGPLIRARQLQGQPASRGFCRGRARVIERPEQMPEFKVGEVLVVDSIDPNMTFLAPLALGIVERRGGMLIHGAIIAREYGIPCVTGVSAVLRYIRTGDMVTVDGYLGLVIVDRDTDSPEK